MRGDRRRPGTTTIAWDEGWLWQSGELDLDALKKGFGERAPFQPTIGPSPKGFEIG